ncbi:hypothetical protein RHGRI_034731 [Rhododendron griersonianum]|uniref:RPN1 N-terminal domain-containing protein n=1 Tax=Rhododendron griersonianum TaxID=479676 RepID=A0AAV6I6C7_9ERIC|nr:hypothetical protein RHGRI_034731 [Rhododendron griersonianum]
MKGKEEEEIIDSEDIREFELDEAEEEDVQEDGDDEDEEDVDDDGDGESGDDEEDPYEEVEEEESLKNMFAGSKGVGSWSREYVRDLVREITPEINKRQSKGEDVDDLRELLYKILAFHMENNTESEYEAVDLALELDDIGVVPGYVTSTNYMRIGLYLARIGR